MTSLYDHAITTFEGNATTLAPYRGSVMLIVNVASQCSYTPQYSGLEKLHRELGPRGLAVLGFPCNQFGGQEPGTASEIQQFCSLTYEVTFPVFAKVRVNGSQTHPLWAHLKDERRGLLWTRDVKWNFTKFLVARDGRVVKRWGSRDTPEAIRARIERLLG
jgi:glutathione peroxidase